MDTTVTIALIIAGALIFLALMFYKPIGRRIEGGASPELSFERGKAKRLLAVENDLPGLPVRPAQNDKRSLDIRLEHLTPFPDPQRFQTIELPKREPIEFYAWSSAPVGTFILDRVPFFLHPVGDDTRRLLGHAAINIQPADNNDQTIEEVPAPVRDVVTVHFLLSAGNAWISWDGVPYKGKRVGHIELVFADQSKQRVELVLGKHLREWAFANSPNTVKEVDYDQTQPAWVSYDNTRRIDCMSIAVSGGPKHLNLIRVVAQFEIEHLDKLLPLPSIIISAITCERKV